MDKVKKIHLSVLFKNQHEQESEMKNNNLYENFFSLYRYIEPLFKVSLFLGMLLSWSFFSFYVGVIPSFNSLGDATGYLLFIVLWAVIVVGIIILFGLFPIIMIYDIYIKKCKGILIWFLIIFPFLVWMINKFLGPEHINWILIFTILIIPSLITLLLSLLKIISSPKTSDFWKLWLYFVTISFFISFSILIAFELNQLFLFIIALFLFMNIFLIVFEEELSFKFFLIAIIFGFFSLSTILSMLKIDNPIIVKPFELLKIGYYKAELHFKEDFIKNNNPFIFNDENKTFDTFLILSSIGDEYIIKECRHSEKNSISKKNLHRFFVDEIPYYYEDENKTIWMQSQNKTLVIKEDVNESILLKAEKLREISKNIEKTTYVINKSDVNYRLLGKKIDDQYTSWMIK